LALYKNNIKKAIELMNERLKDVDFDKFYKVDFIMSPEEITLDFVQELDKLKGVWCGTIEEPCILVKGVRVNTNDIELMGSEKNSFKFRLNEDYVSCVKFKCDSNDSILKIKEEEPLGTWVELECIIKVGMNSFNSILSPQAVVQDYNLIKKG
jgi:single-stranded DNA-specific DHH superfamily exonuclease